MPTSPSKPCAHPGCRALVQRGNRCPEHVRVQTRDQDSRRDPVVRALYDGRWRVYSRNRLAANPLCVRCNGLAEVTDHIVPHKGDYDLFWQADNHQSLCKRDHDRKTLHEDGAFGRPVVERVIQSTPQDCPAGLVKGTAQ